MLEMFSHMSVPKYLFLVKELRITTSPTFFNQSNLQNFDFLFFQQDEYSVPVEMLFKAKPTMKCALTEPHNSWIS